MEVNHLAPGEHGPENCDRLRLGVDEDGKFDAMGIRLNGNVTAHSILPGTYDTEDEALAVGLAWAEENNIQVLHVERPNA